MSLNARAIGYSYAVGTTLEQRALDDVDVSVSTGEVVLILGHTGSGKSTLLRVLAGLVSPGSGSITVDDVVTQGPVGAVGVVFQDPEAQLFAETVLEDVAFAPRNAGHSRAQCHEIAKHCMREVGLDPEVFGPRSPFTLSGGEARRAAIAGVLALDPAYLLLDEPTAGLDERGCTSVLETIQAIRSRAGVVVVSHSAERFLGIADKVLLMAGGSVVWNGTARQLLDTPDVFTSAGLRPPALIAVQAALRDAGLEFGQLTLDPDELAARVMGARGVA